MDESWNLPRVGHSDLLNVQYSNLNPGGDNLLILFNKIIFAAAAYGSKYENYEYVQNIYPEAVSEEDAMTQNRNAS